MRNILYLILLMVSFPSIGEQFAYQDINGEWGAYEEKRLSDDWYQYLEIGANGGVFAYSYGGAPKIIRFESSELRRLPGMLLIEPQCCGNQQLRLVVSAFRTKAGSALLTGSMFMFQSEAGMETLFNTIPLRMELLQKDSGLREHLKELRSEIHK